MRTLAHALAAPLVFAVVAGAELSPQALAHPDVHQCMNALLIAGMMSELNYMSTEEQEAALALECELLADAAAGVDLRIRLIGDAVSE